MATLLETLNNNLRNSTNLGAQATGMQDSTAQLQQLSRAKGGKAIGGGSTPRLSNVQEQVATSNAANQLDSMRQEANLQAETQSQQADHYSQQATQQNEIIDEERLQVQETYSRQVESILRDLSRNDEELSFRKDAARVEQAGFLLRLQNDQYLENLNNEAARAQLDNELAFREELARTIFAEEESLFRNDLFFRSLLGADERRFTEEMANINLDFALEMAEAESTQKNQQMLWTGAGNLISGGIQAWEKFGSDSSDTKKAQGGN